MQEATLNSWRHLVVSGMEMAWSSNALLLFLKLQRNFKEISHCLGVRVEASAAQLWSLDAVQGLPVLVVVGAMGGNKSQHPGSRCWGLFRAGCQSWGGIQWVWWKWWGGIKVRGGRDPLWLSRFSTCSQFNSLGEGLDLVIPKRS